MTTARACPDCSAAVDVIPGYPDWCDECGWNVRAPDPPEWGFGNRFDAAMARLGRRSGERLSRRLREQADLRPHWTPARVAAYVIAVAVIAASFLLMGGAIAMVIAGGLNVLVWLLAAALFGIGWFLRPRLGRVDLEHAVGPDRAPELHALIGDVAAALDVPPPDVLIVPPEFNAGWGVFGLRRRRMLMIGSGPLAVLRPPELVALLAHELGHARNGDARRGLVVGSAVDGLAELHALMVPDGIWMPPSGSVADAAAPLAEVAQRVAALPVLGVLLVEAHLLLRDMRRAEYLADELAARVAGTRATIALHERLGLSSTYDLALQRAAHEPAADGLFARLREAFDAVPDRERARRQAVARLEGTRLDATHPPTALRIALLEERPEQPPKVVVGTVRADRLAAELDALEPQLAAELLDRERGRHYW